MDTCIKIAETREQPPFQIIYIAKHLDHSVFACSCTNDTNVHKFLTFQFLKPD